MNNEIDKSNALINEKLSELKKIPDEISGCMEENKVLMQKHVTRSLVLSTSIDVLVNENLQKIMEQSDKKHKRIFWTSIITLFVALITLVYSWNITNEEKNYKNEMEILNKAISISINHSDSVICRIGNKIMNNEIVPLKFCDSIIIKLEEINNTIKHKN